MLRGGRSYRSDSARATLMAAPDSNLPAVQRHAHQRGPDPGAGHRLGVYVSRSGRDRIVAQDDGNHLFDIATSGIDAERLFATGICDNDVEDFGKGGSALLPRVQGGTVGAR